MTNAQFINDLGSTLVVAAIIFFGTWLCLGGTRVLSNMVHNIKKFLSGEYDEYDENWEYLHD